MAAARRYYPGFLGALFLVLLRIAIGWHFLNEGLEKYDSGAKEGKPFTAEPYLRNATGPLAPYFRGMIPDVNGLAKLDPARLKGIWTADVDGLSRHYSLDDTQRTEASKILRRSLHDSDTLFADRDFSEDRRKYIADLAAVQRVERDPGALSYERERAYKQRKELDTKRKELLAKVDAIGDALHEAVAKLANDEQKAAAGPYAPPRESLDWVNDLTMYGLIAMGFCLIAGLFTPLAALAAAVFLAQIYLSMPPWPWLPASPKAEGHYNFVDKNLIELLACLALTFIPTGQWIGLDALVFGRKVVPEADEAAVARPTAAAPAPSPGSNQRTAPDVSPIPLSSPGLTERD